MATSISNISIFGEYKQPENRITAALLHLLKIGGDSVIQRLFGDLIDIPSNEISIISQSNAGNNSIPDGELSCNCNYKILIESKIQCNAINKTQLAAHKKIKGLLIYITPDRNEPTDLVANNVPWISWSTIIIQLQGFIADGCANELLGYLIDQFILLVNNVIYKTDIPQNESVIIVGGSFGENVALNYNFYACQKGRVFKPSKYIAFCHQHRIKYLFEIISEQYSVDIQTLQNVCATDYFAKIEPNYSSELRDYYELKKIKEFVPEIKNDKVDKNGNPCAFTQRQTYTSYTKIMKAKKTSDL